MFEMRSKAKGGETTPRQTNYLLQIKFRFWNGFPISDSVNLQWEKKCKPKIKGGVLNCQALTAEVPNDQSPAERTRRW